MDGSEVQLIGRFEHGDIEVLPIDRCAAVILDARLRALRPVLQFFKAHRFARSAPLGTETHLPFAGQLRLRRQGREIRLGGRCFGLSRFAEHDEETLRGREIQRHEGFPVANFKLAENAHRAGHRIP